MKANNTPDNNALLLGMGFDNTDGQRRITKGDNFCLVGGSEETHERMTETTIKFNEKLARKGKHLSELSREEFMDMMNPPAAIPAASVTAYSSAMPTSIKLLGCFSSTALSPVPSFIAAVIATTLSSLSIS